MIFRGNIKSTETIEQERVQLWKDYQTYIKVEGSEKLKNYLASKEKVESKTFQENKKQIESLKYKGSSEEKMVREFEKLEKNSNLRTYFSVKASVDLDRYTTINKSGVQKKLEELEREINSAHFKSKLKELSHKKNHDASSQKELSELLAAKKEHESLETSEDIKFCRRYLQTKSYKTFLKVEGSSLLNQYNKLKEEIGSESFKEKKNYLEDKNRYEKTDDYKTLSTYQSLGNDPEIKLYLKYHQTDSFKFFREWQPSFTDEFDGKIDKSKWSFTSPIAEKGPGRNFAIKSQLHTAHNDDNFNVENSIITLETTRHKTEGLYWDEQFGFVKKTFEYTSGLAHTLHHFKQEYGLFEVKVKASKVKGVVSSISLVDEDEDVCIRIFNSNGSLTQGGMITTDHLQKKFTPIKLNCPSRGYAIVGLNWTPEKLEWSVNGKVVGSISQSVPHIKLGLRIESEVVKETGSLPHRLDIDWIRCFARKK